MKRNAYIWKKRKEAGAQWSENEIKANSAQLKPELGLSLAISLEMELRQGEKLCMTQSIFYPVKEELLGHILAS